MEAATAERPTEVPDSEDRATHTPAQLFRYSTWLHVGPGADECEAVNEAEGTCDCSDPLHFHGWCRLPNQFQHREIREKALAGRARKTRQLRDPESDAAAILEEELDQLGRLGDDAKQQLVEELAGKDWWKDYMEAVAAVREEEDDQGEKRYEHVERDQARAEEIAAMPEDKRPVDELESLERHLATYNDRVEEEMQKLIQPRRDALNDRDINGLIDLVRDDRIQSEATQEFMHIYNTWEWFVGTLDRPRGDRKFASLEQMQASAPEVIEALKETFTDLEATKNRGLQGNS